MKATEINLLKFLKQPNQFQIPIYQRTYSWTLKQCQQLWQDLVRLSQEDKVTGHFVGSIVYIEAGLYLSFVTLGRGKYEVWHKKGR
jgi:uncharacterized protein with ParB-like and HNH nuclease domain